MRYHKIVFAEVIPRLFLLSPFNWSTGVFSIFFILSRVSTSIISVITVGTKHGFLCINICKVLGELLKTEDKVWGFNNPLRDLKSVTAMKTMLDCYYCINSTTIL